MFGRLRHDVVVFHFRYSAGRSLNVGHFFEQVHQLGKLKKLAESRVRWHMREEIYTMNNIPKMKIGIVAVSRDCFPESLSVNRRKALVDAYAAKYDAADIYECPVCISLSTIHTGHSYMSAASYFAAYASTSAFLLFTDRLSGKQSRLTATIPIFIFGILFIV